MAGHTSEKRWEDKQVGTQRLEGVSPRAQLALKDLVTQLVLAEEAYQQMQEIYTYAGGTATDLANLLFKEEIASRGESVADQSEIDRANDLVNAMTAAHQVYQAANNVAVTQSDRLSDMRRMI